MAEQVHIFVTGVVQGVFFRVNTEKKARELDLKGWVRNTEDGEVEIIAQGSKESLQSLIEWCKSDSPGTTDDVRVSRGKPEQLFSDFSIK